MLFAKFVDQFHTIAIGKAQVQHDDIRPAVFQQRPGFAQRHGGLHVKALH